MAVAVEFVGVAESCADATGENIAVEAASADNASVGTDVAVTTFLARLPDFFPLPFVVSAAATNVPAVAFHTDLYALFISLISQNYGGAAIADRLKNRAMPVAAKVLSRSSKARPKLFTHGGIYRSPLSPKSRTQEKTRRRNLNERGRSRFVQFDCAKHGFQALSAQRDAILERNRSWYGSDKKRDVGSDF